MKGSPTAAAARPPYDAVILDLDGVVTTTATVHQAAWKDAYEAIIRDPRFPPDADRRAFKPGDYFGLLDGKPREQGLMDLMASRGVRIPAGLPSDPTGEWTAFGLGALKNKAYLARLRTDGVKTYPGTVQFLAGLKASGVPTAVVTSSRNATAVLAAAGMEDTFAAVLDGTTATAMGLPGKPSPEVFLEAAHRLNVPPTRAVVIEDSVAGVESAHRGGFGLVVGIDRRGIRNQLEAAGASVVLNDVSELDLGLVMGEPWQLIFEGTDPDHEGHREALTTLGNGYMGVRGAVMESNRTTRYAGMYLAGVFNRVPSGVGQETVFEEHMVNGPDCLPMDLRLEGGSWWSRDGLRVIHERRTLQMDKAVLARRLVLESPDGRRLEVSEARLVSMADPHLMALKTRITPLGWSGLIGIRVGVDVGVRNANLPEPPLTGRKHLTDRTTFDGAGADQANTLMVEAETSQSQIRIGVGLRADVGGIEGIPGSKGAFHFRTFESHCSDGAAVTVTRIVAVVTSRDRPISSAGTAAAASLERAGTDFDKLLRAHEAAWQRTIRPFKVELDAPAQVKLVLNLHLFHLLQTLTRHTSELDVGVPARGLHGEGYRGHVFWDELFVLPVLTSRTPDVARALLDYRWRRLPAARQAAAGGGLAGARFPWQSGSDSTEETPRWLYNARSGRMVPDHSHLQRHVGLAVAFNAWQYFEATNDLAWLSRKGADLVVEVARYFAAVAEYDSADHRYHIRGVVGPDEYHTCLPGNRNPGLDDNAYTNVMAAWVCACAAGIPDTFSGHELADLLERLCVTEHEVARWGRLSRAMFVPFTKDGIISQFAGYDRLEELDWDKYRQRYDNIERLDLILEAEGDDVNRYKLAKQADVLMLPYLMGRQGLISFLGRLGYALQPEQLDRTVEYYLARTAHGSTLSRVAHASVLAALDPERAWESFREALDADLDDTQHGTTKAGIHLGAMAGTIDVVQRSFAGLRLDRMGLSFTPNMPHGLRSVSFHVTYRGHFMDIQLKDGRIRISSAPGDAPPVRVTVHGQTVMLACGDTRSFRMQSTRRSDRQ
ncbi:HAD-IA family hydrolase [Paenarthrobacter sp. YIM B13468]|uniref:HAD-IA family hydrolase n=1 Tax=Paenarthrobacter sp. YIM B13468 TaxID=3366295 RepID=UPI00366FA4EF